jgi:glycerophosphoryl diester phosphodiesterase
VQTLDIGAWFNRTYPKRAADKFAGETVPALTGLFDFLKDYKGRVYVELKDGGEMLPLVEAVGKMIRQTDLLPNVIVKSFNLEAVAQFKKLFPEITTAALFEPKIALLLCGRRSLIELARNCGADELSLHYSLATKKLVESAAREDLPVTIWTVDRPVWVRRASEIGVQAIITNNPARLIAARGRATS